MLSLDPMDVSEDIIPLAVVTDLDEAGMRLLEVDGGRFVLGAFATSLHDAKRILENRTVRVLLIGSLAGDEPFEGADLTFVRDAKDRRPDIAIVLHRRTLDPIHVRAALKAGVDGYCLATTPGRRLTQALEAVAIGATWLDPDAARAAFSRNRLRPVGELPRLSPREREILSLLTDGCSNEEIADQLDCAAATVKTHLLHLFRKLGVRDRVSAAVWALRNNVA